MLAILCTAPIGIYTELVFMHCADLFADGDFGGAAHHHPVFGTVSMLLQRKNSAGNDNDALHLKALAHVNRIRSSPMAGARVYGRSPPSLLAALSLVTSSRTSCARDRGTTITASDVLTITRSLTPTRAVSLSSEWTTQSASIHGHDLALHDVAVQVGLA